ncbi:MAG: M23 family metallopeptidase [Lysobacterales bacterium]
MHPISHKNFRHVLIFALLWVSASLANESCFEDWVCVEPVGEGDQLEFFATNLKPWPIAVSFRAEVTNLKGPKRSVTVEINGSDRVKIASYRRQDAGKRYRYQYWYDYAVGRLTPKHADNYPYALPYAAGESWRILQGFGSRFSHTGREGYAVDFGMPVGSQVMAARDGTVVQLREQHNRGCWDKECAKYANFLVVLHDDGTTGEYYHLQQNGVLVEIGQKVNRGQLIALSGNTGHSTTPHLHFAVYRADTWGRTQSLPFRFVDGGKKLGKPRGGQRHLKSGDS